MADQEAFIQKYQHQRFYDVYPVVSALLVIATLGIFGNFNIVWATCRKKSLRSRCNIMIAATAFSDIFHQSSHFILAHDLFLGNTFISLRRCFYLQAFNAFCMNFGTFIVLSIGIDRLISITCPMVYKQSNSKVYMFVTLFFPIAYALWLTATAYPALAVFGDQLTLCVIASAYHDTVKDTWIHSTLIVNICIIGVYSAAYISTKMKTTKFEKRIFRSLMVITSLVLFGWFTASLIFSLAIGWGWKAETLVKTMLYAGTCCINTTIALNYPVYFYFCKEYRVAFLEQLKILTCRYEFRKNRTGVSTIPITSSKPSDNSSVIRSDETRSTA